MWKIANVEISNRIVSAPMAGISNETYRYIIKQMGAGLIYTEMISIMGIVYNSKNTIDMLKINDFERPISVETGYEAHLDCNGVKPSDVQIEEDGIITYIFLGISNNITCSITVTPTEETGN